MSVTRVSLARHVTETRVYLVPCVWLPQVYFNVVTRDREANSGLLGCQLVEALLYELARKSVREVFATRQVYARMLQHPRLHDSAKETFAALSSCR